MSRRSAQSLIGLLAGAAGIALAAVALTGAGRAESPPGMPGPRALANGCFALLSARDGRAVTIDGGTYRAVASRKGRLSRFHFKPTRPGAFLLHDGAGALVSLGGGSEIERRTTRGVDAEWRVRPVRDRDSLLISPTTRAGFLAVDPASAEVVLARRGDGAVRRFRLQRVRRCTRFPEARVGASGRPGRSVRRDGSIKGFADIHMHVAANLRAGGRVVHGESFHRFGLPEALGHDQRDHGPDGSLDVIGNFLREGQPAATHDIEGWPGFSGWPVHDTYTHQQAYYVWLKRVWKAGMRVLVTQAVEDEALCRLAPLRSHSCDETETVKLAVRHLRALESYVDAQSGGPGRGWLRIVTGPAQARRVAERGKLAVVIGMETSSPLGCSEFMRIPQCDREQIDRVLGELHRLGVRSVFIAHWVDNAFGGAALQSGAQGDFIDVFQTMTTGHPFATEPCGRADEADGTCNATGFTPLGRYLVRRMMEKGMLIEADHLSQRARRAVFRIAKRHRYPLVSSHTGTGGEWTPRQLRRLSAIGGMTAATPETAPKLVRKINRLRRHADPAHGRAVALGSDTGGFAALPGPRPGGAPLRYPFRSHDGTVSFKRQRTGDRTYGLNRDGVAHYGLFADLIADMRGRPGSRRALRSLFGSAEAFLRTWEMARR